MTNPDISSNKINQSEEIIEDGSKGNKCTVPKENDLKKIKEVRNVTKVISMKPPLSHRCFVGLKKNPNSLHFKKQLDS